MKNKNLIMAIAAALYSPSFYREVGQRWRARSFAYLLVLLAICWLFISFSKTLDFCTTVGRVGVLISQQMPTLHIKSGVITSKIKNPLKMRVNGHGTTYAVIDLNNKYKKFKTDRTQILVRDTYIKIKKSDHEVSTYYLPKTLNATFGPNTISNIMINHGKRIMTVTFFAVYFVGLIFSYIWYIVLSMIYGLIGMIFSGLNKARLEYGSLLGLALVAITPAVLLQTLFVVMGLTFMFQYLLYFVVAMIYLFCAVRANKAQE